MAYNSEDSWEDPQQKPWAETDETGLPEGENGVVGDTRFEPAAQNPELTVPADAEKAGNANSPKKKIPKWQWGVLGGFVVIAIGGGAAFVLLDGHSSSVAPMQQQMGLAASPASHLPQRATTPLMQQKSLSGSIGHPEASPKSGFAPDSAAMSAQTPSPSGMSGFATLNQLSGDSTTATSHPAANTSMTAEDASPSPVSALPTSAMATPAEETTKTSTLSSLQSPVVLSPAPTAGLPAGTPMVSSTTASAANTVNPTVVRLQAEIAASKAKIAQLQDALQSDKTASAPRVVTRTIVRYVHVPVAAPAPRVTMAHPASPSRTESAWSVVGGNGHVAMVSGPGGQVQSVRAGDVLPGGMLVQRIGLGKVITNEGVIR
ncbi:hypothetical protein [Acidithiobacillus sulfurivorans]|uniref:Type IV secretion protein DotG n=1 Tax=Acidithiobacillus sulfurivorans TaxID=1958756 RepID=A0ABS5ZVL2_9PROT|nr:hypothetical protein [Acidithiobacillus sulfurivorans]MBU2759262.1 hypothetical protein [Acidithiobacillus sulfurivorans]